LSKVSPLWPQNYIPIVEASSVGLRSDTLLHKIEMILRRGSVWHTGPWGNTLFSERIRDLSTIRHRS